VFFSHFGAWEYAFQYCDLQWACLNQRIIFAYNKIPRIDCLILMEGNGKTRKETCFSVTFSNANRTCADLGFLPFLYVERQATDRLSYDVAPLVGVDVGADAESQVLLGWNVVHACLHLCGPTKPELCCVVFVCNKISTAKNIFLFTGQYSCTVVTMLQFSYLYTVAGECVRRTREGATEVFQPLSGLSQNRSHNHLIYLPISIIFTFVLWLQC
jgi:hypothetical protein